MRESFVFHFEYLEDIPEELQAEWAMNVINYARNDVEPTLTDWRDVRMWNRIKDRIDTDTSKYERRCKNLRNARPIEKREPKTEPPKQNVQEVKPESQKQTEEKKQSARFEKPTAEEVQQYIAEKQYTKVNATKFIDYYESNGWKVGRNPMKNWKAAVSSWEHNGYYDTGQKTGTLWGNENEVPEEILNIL